MLPALPLLAAVAAPLTIAPTPFAQAAPQDAPAAGEPDVAPVADDKALAEAPAEVAEPTASETRALGGKLKVGGAIRARYDLRFNDTGGSGQRRTSSHLSYDTIALTADYTSDRFFGSAQYRFFGGNFIYGKSAGYKNYPGEVNFLMYGYGGVHLTKQDDITIGVQPVPFDDRFWGSSILNDLAFVYGMEETYNLGAKYARNTPEYRVELGFFPSSGPAGMGISGDASRYSTNIARADPYVPNGSRNDERNMVIGNVRHTLMDSGNTKLQATVSAWLSSIYNFDTRRSGSKRLFAASLSATHGAWHVKALVARHDIDPRNPGRNDIITVGGFDSSYNIATKGAYVFGEIGRTIDTGKFPFNIDLYVNYGKFMKSAAGFRDSERLDLGAVWTSKDNGRIKVFSELLIGRNDPYVGAGQFLSGAAQGGDNRIKTAFMVIAGYYF